MVAQRRGEDVDIFEPTPGSTLEFHTDNERKLRGTVER